MAARQYKSIVDTKTLATAVTTAGQGTITLNNITNLPSLTTGQTFTLVINPDTTTEEIVTVTSYGSGTVLNITRGSDGTTAQSSHGIGSSVKHMVTPRDLQEPQDHIYSTTGVHGITGPFASTTDTQTLTNKTLTAPTINSPVVSGGTYSSPAITGGTIAGTVTNSGNITGGAYYASSISLAVSGTGNINLGNAQTTTLTANGVNISTAEVSRLSGVTSAIQTQIDSKVSTSALGVWQTWTPTTNSANWSGSWSNAKYCQIGKTVHFRATFTANGSSTATAFNISLPVTAVAANNVVYGTGTGTVSGAGNQMFTLDQTSTTAVDIRYLKDFGAAGTGISHAAVTGSLPGAWANTNFVTISGTYEAA